MEIFNIHCIRLNLRLQTECLTFIINMAVFAMFLINKISSIKLYTRTVGKYIHLDSSLLRPCLCDFTDTCFIVSIRHIVMVISTCDPELFKISLNLIPDLVGLAEIHRSSLYRCILSQRNRSFTNRCILFCMNR